MYKPIKEIQNLADEITPIISEYLQETIAWQTDGNKLAESLSGDKYLEFVNELRKKIIQDLL